MIFILQSFQVFSILFYSSSIFFVLFFIPLLYFSSLVFFLFFFYFLQEQVLIVSREWVFLLSSPIFLRSLPVLPVVFLIALSIEQLSHISSWYLFAECLPIFFGLLLSDFFFFLYTITLLKFLYQFHGILQVLFTLPSVLLCCASFPLYQVLILSPYFPLIHDLFDLPFFLLFNHH